MSFSENLFRATLNRINARIQNTISSSITNTAVFVQNAPDRIKKEFRLFKDEVINEAEKLDQRNNREDFSQVSEIKNNNSFLEQNKIASIRNKLRNLTNKVEELN